MVKYVIDIDEDNLDNNDIYCIVANAISLEKVLADLPVTPTRKKGKWIFSKTIFDKHGFTVECWSCHKKWKTYDEIRWKKENKFCPNCGAKMESEE